MEGITIKNILLTGPIGVGKTTLLYKIIERLNLSIGGFKVDRHINQIGASETKTFILSSYLNGRDKYKMAYVHGTNGYFDIKVFKEAFDEASNTIINRSIRERDVVVLDEIGVMESCSQMFQESIINAFESTNLVLGILKDQSSPFLDSIRNRNDIHIIKVTVENRNNLLDLILDEILDHYKDGSVIRYNYFSSNPKRIQWYNNALDYAGCQYPDIFLDKIHSYLDIKDKTVLDIGSGTGAFALPLAKKAKKVTALDFSINMREFLEIRCANEGINNVEFIVSPFETLPLENHNIIINAFASSVTKSYSTMKKIIDLADDYVFIISHHEKDKYKFGADILGKRLNRNLLTERSEPEDDIHTMLTTFGVDYDYSEVEFSFPQYFEDKNDAINFFITYFELEENEVSVAKEFLEETLIKIDNGYVFPENRSSRFIVIKKH